MIHADSQFLLRLGDLWQGATPGFVLQAYAGGRKMIDVEVGQTYRYYDWASLTKIVFTTSALMIAFDEQLYRLSDTVEQWVEWFPPAADNTRTHGRTKTSGATLQNLLSHDAGLTWWYPFYKTVVHETDAQTTPEEAWRVFQRVLKTRITADARKGKSAVSAGPAVYSDLDFFTLGAAVESIFGATLTDVWLGVRERLKLHDTDFSYGNRPQQARRFYAPTEVDSWRKGSHSNGALQGEVHDENAWSLRGVAPHAGLFGTIDDLSEFGLAVRKALAGKRSFVSEKTAHRFSRRSVPRSRGDWALGWMMPSRPQSSCGQYFSSRSIGHTGFTGTSLWYDPKRDLLVTILSNRVYPTRENREFVSLRPMLHNFVVESIQ